jgi:hypothetical protein
MTDCAWEMVYHMEVWLSEKQSDDVCMSIQFNSIQFNSIQWSALRHTYTYIPGNWQGLWMELRERRELLMAPTSKCEGHDSPASALTTLPRHRSYPPFPKVPFHLCVPILLERTSESPTICKLLKWDSGLKGSSKAFKIPFQAISSTSADENVCYICYQHRVCFLEFQPYGCEQHCRMFFLSKFKSTWPHLLGLIDMGKWPSSRGS